MVCPCLVSCWIHLQRVSLPLTVRHTSLNSLHTGWSDIYGLTSNDKEDREGFDESAARVNTLVQQEIDKGISPSRIVIGGFSQGGAVAFHTALRSPHTLGGVVALSTWVPLRADYPAAFSAAMSTVPILQVCSVFNVS